MKKEWIAAILIRLIVLGGIFVAAVYIVGSYVNRGESLSTEEMADATFPVVYFQIQNHKLNELHGYDQEMQANYMRDALMPLPNDRILPVRIATYDNKITGLAYEIISTDGNEVVETKKAVPFLVEEDFVTADLEIDNNMMMNKEYVLRIIVSTQGKDVNYYTRIIQKDRLNTAKYLDFIHKFVNLSLDKFSHPELSTYLETNGEGDNSTLAKVTINSDAEQFTWGEMHVTLESPIVPVIKEINPTTASIVVDYFVSAQDDDGNKEIYQVSEFYRLRYSSTRVYLLNFERNVEEKFQASQVNFSEEQINLGIRTRDINYATNKDGTIISFVQDSELWCYNSSSEKLYQVFSFQKDDSLDIRNTYRNHRIKILDVDDSGSMDFIVYGYMNRGIYEGRNGVILYHFSSETSSVEERVFIPINKNYALMEQDIGNLSFTSIYDLFYIMVGGTIYEVDLETGEYKVMADDLKNDCYAVSSDNRRVAWIKENSLASSKTIVVMELETKETYEVACSDNESIRPLGFMGTDFVYGVAHRDELKRDSLGNLIFPMYKIEIRNEDGDIERDYQSDGIYILDVEFDDETMNLKRMQKQNGSFITIQDDSIFIMDQEVTQENSSQILRIITDRKQTEYGLSLTNGSNEVKLQILKPKQVVFDVSKEVEIMTKAPNQTYYYVYAYGKLENVYLNANNAIVKADEMVGVVVNENMEYIWERGNQDSSKTIDLDSIPDVVKEGNMSISQLQERMDETVLDLNSCTLEQVLYYVSRGSAVLAKTPTGTAVIVGYDEFNTIWYDMETGETKFYGKNDSTAMFEEAGNVFISYLNLFKSEDEESRSNGYENLQEVDENYIRESQEKTETSTGNNIQVQEETSTEDSEAQGDDSRNDNDAGNDELDNGNDGLDPGGGEADAGDPDDGQGAE